MVIGSPKESATNRRGGAVHKQCIKRKANSRETETC